MIRKEVIKSNKAPAAIGPYSQAIKAAGLIFVSGQIPIDPLTGEIVEGGIEEQTERVLKNIEVILEAANSGIDQAVKTTIYLKDMNDFASVNKIYEKRFSYTSPARATVEVSNLPKNASIEIDVIALAS